MRHIHLTALFAALLWPTAGLQAQQSLKITKRPVMVAVGDSVQLEFTAINAAGRVQANAAVRCEVVFGNSATARRNVWLFGQRTGASVAECIWAPAGSEGFLWDTVTVQVHPAPEPEPEPEPEPPLPTLVHLTGLPDTMVVGDSAHVTGALLDQYGGEMATAPADWSVDIEGPLRYRRYYALTNVVRAHETGEGRVRYTHRATGLSATAVTQVVPPAPVEPRPDSVARVIIEWCAPQLFGTAAWIERADVTLPEGDSAWIRGVALNYRGDRLIGKQVTLTVSDTTKVRLRGFASGAMTPCGPA